ncbi:MAG TPA: hypothetical protein VFG08_08395 [Candidatus Polarisedimenticolia bacterium]|nr:hypothetical protein [Candidatus Polarisedimenticolia bacterium]
MTVRRPALVACLLLAATCLRADEQLEADPHELLESAQERLSAGDLRGCAGEIGRLRALISRSPQWDPEGAFSNHLMPPVAAALARLQAAAGALDEFERRALRDLQPPDPGPDMDTVGDYSRWATSAIEGLRAERDGIIQAALSDPGERAILTRTESYARTERLLEIDVLMKMADTAGDEVVGLLSGDPDIESILVRFRQIKQKLILVAAERDNLQRQLGESEERSRTLREALAATGLGPDRSESIGAPTQAVEEIPASPESDPAPRPRGWIPILVIIVSAAAGAGLVARLLVVRWGRRQVLRPLPRLDGRREVDAPVRQKDAGRDAA